jgi:cytochrome c5
MNKRWTGLLGLALLGAAVHPLFAGDASVESARTAFSCSEDGARIYDTYCFQCHGTGFAGAPRANEADAWSPRVAAGYDTLLKNSKQGLKGMPPMGTCETCTDDQLRAAIAEMLQFE